jgi:hypothetical protein
MEKMKRMIRLTAITIIIMMFMMIAFTGVAVASRPAEPTPETAGITTVTMIKCIGMVTHETKFKWESSNEDLLNSLQPGEVYGKVTYNEDLKALGGETEFVKDLGIDTGDTPNLDVMTSMGYKAGEIGALSYDESASMTLIANPAATGDVVLCPFASVAVPMLPASCEEVSAGSSMMVTEVLATTITKVGITESPVNLRYEIDATGIGDVAAGMGAFIESGSLADVGAYSLGTRMSYVGRSSASGVWDFSKTIEYVSAIRP